MTWMVKEVSEHAELLTDGTRGIFFFFKKTFYFVLGYS